MKLPKTLRIGRDHKVYIKALEIGSINKVGPEWFFTGTHEVAPATLQGLTAKSIKEQLTTAIPRDTYVALVEAQPDG